MELFTHKTHKLALLFPKYNNSNTRTVRIDIEIRNSINEIHLQKLLLKYNKLNVLYPYINLILSFFSPEPVASKYSPASRSHLRDLWTWNVNNTYDWRLVAHTFNYLITCVSTAINQARMYDISKSPSNPLPLSGSWCYSSPCLLVYCILNLQTNQP